MNGQSNEQERKGHSISFVLLEQPDWDKERFIKDLKLEWGLDLEEVQGDAGDDNSLVLVGEVEGMVAAVSLIEAPVPNGEAELNAANNYMWPEAAETTKRHGAHLIVAVLPREGSLIEANTLLVKLCDTCLMEANAIGVFTAGTVFQPAFYRNAATVMRDGEMPYLNWIYFGLMYTAENVMNGYTYGLEAFGKDEIEVVGTSANPEQLRDFLFGIAAYVLAYDVTLNDGETIGFSEDEKLPITRSEGVSLDGETLKIEYMPAV